MARTFQHLRPGSPREACELKAQHGGAAVFWAGGTDLLLQWRRGAIDFELPEAEIVLGDGPCPVDIGGVASART